MITFGTVLQCEEESVLAVRGVSSRELFPK
jgi:hypothetical protein